MSKSVVVMHMSDLHFGVKDKTNKDYVANREAALDEIFNCIIKISNDWQPDILVITGDIAYKGASEDYIQAKNFIDKFLDLKCHKVTKNDIIICPGNHDVKLPDDFSKPDLTNRKTFDNDLNRSCLGDYYLAKFNNYINFLKQFRTEDSTDSFKLCNTAGTSTSPNESSKYLYGYRECKGLHFVVLNSEWDFLGKDDKYAEGHLRLGVDLIADAFEQVRKKNAWPVITVMHRSFRDLDKTESWGPNSSTKKILAQSEFVLSGHMHEERFLYEACVPRLTVGAIHSTDCSIYRFNLYKFEQLEDRNKTTCRTRVYMFDPKNNNWQRDQDSRTTAELLKPYFYTAQTHNDVKFLFRFVDPNEKSSGNSDGLKALIEETEKRKEQKKEKERQEIFDYIFNAPNQDEALKRLIEKHQCLQRLNVDISKIINEIMKLSDKRKDSEGGGSSDKAFKTLELRPEDPQ